MMQFTPNLELKNNSGLTVLTEAAKLARKQVREMILCEKKITKSLY
jgi:hypothetical protein